MSYRVQPRYHRQREVEESDTYSDTGSWDNDRSEDESFDGEH